MIRQVPIIYTILIYALLASCEGEDHSSGGKTTDGTVYNLSLNKAAFSPGEQVQVTISPVPSNAIAARVKHMNTIVSESEVTGGSWTWLPPTQDFQGYLLEIVDKSSEPERIAASIAIDVSSDWTKFPRYGFLSRFPQMTETQIKAVLENLNRHHINGIQFYDWHYKHHRPLAGTPENPTPVYRDIINRDIYFNTVKKYIEEGHRYNIRAMFYNLVYGALDDAAEAGVQEEWYVYTDQNGLNKDRHPLPRPPFISDIFLTNPSNSGWQAYLINENRKVYAALPFDGFHMDQLGDRGTRYLKNGAFVDLSQTFKPFIEAMRNDAPEKAIVLNAVNQYGQPGIAAAPVDFLYTEVWSPNESYAHLADLIKQNNILSSNSKNTVLAAYVNYRLADNPGSFNSASVLFTDAVIFSFGASHLELGEHMLGKEYFPNSNLAMREDLKRKLIAYYDFHVAYQNLLRDGGTLNLPSVSSTDFRIQFKSWPPEKGKVAVAGRETSSCQIVHLLNFRNAVTLDWRDNSGVQTMPLRVENVRIKVNVAKPVKKIWWASPDIDHGASHELQFTTTGSDVSFTVPALELWDMIVLEYH